jgi:tetratricopeptide (TPR) repeat protein
MDNGNDKNKQPLTEAQPQANTPTATEVISTPSAEKTEKANIFKSLLSSGKQLWDKIGKTPLFTGKRKFITIPLIVLILAAIIAVPMIIVSTNQPSSDYIPEPEPTAFELIRLRDTAIRANDLAESGNVEGAIAMLDEAIVAAENSEAQQIYLHFERRAIAANNGLYDIALESQFWRMEGSRKRNDTLALRDGYAYLGELYEAMGDKQRAIDAYRMAVQLSDEIGGSAFSGYGFFLERIETLTAELGQ